MNILTSIAFAAMISVPAAQDSMMNPMARLNTRDVLVGSMPMSPMKSIVQNAVDSKDHTTLVAAVKQAGLVEALSSKGPFTVFAPVNSAFDKLPKDTVANLMMDENKDALRKVLTYHVVAGRYDSKAIREAIRKSGGMAKLKTLEGGTLTAMMNGPANIVVVDETGGVANISTYDVYQSNGVIHVIDSVLLPK